MMVKLGQSVLISLVVLVLATGLGYAIVSYTSLDNFWSKESARYLFSSISQSLAALFALTFVVLNFITAFASKDLAKYVFRYVFSLRITSVAISLFIFLILYNFIYLGYIYDNNQYSHAIVNYRVGFIANIFLFLISMILLVLYAYKTYSISVAPFDPFLKEIKKGIVPALKSFIPFLESRVEFEKLISEKKIEWSLEWLCEGMNFIRHEGKAGHIRAISSKKIREASKILAEEREPRIVCFEDVEYGRWLEKGKYLFAYDTEDTQLRGKISKILSNAVSTQKVMPGEIPNFGYLRPLFRIAEEQMLNPRAFKDYIDKLADIGEIYLSKRRGYLQKYDIQLKKYNYPEMIDHWFSELYELVKKACIVKRELEASGRVLTEEDKPDNYLRSCLYRVASKSYKFDEVVYFNKALELIWNYVYFSYSPDERKIPSELLNQLNPILDYVSSLSIDELKEKLDCNKLRRYRNIILRKFLIALKQCPYGIMTKMAYRKYRRLKKYLIDDIEHYLLGISNGDRNILFEYLRDTCNSVLGILFALSIYKYSKVQPGCAKETVEDFIRYITEFIPKMHEHEVLRYYGRPVPRSIFIEPIMAKAEKDIDELQWFMPMTHMDDLIEEPGVHLGEELKTRPYCLNVFFLILCFTESSFVISGDYWIPVYKDELRIRFKEFEESVVKANTPNNLILNEHFNRDQDKIDKVVQSVKRSVESFIEHSK